MKADEVHSQAPELSPRLSASGRQRTISRKRLSNPGGNPVLPSVQMPNRNLPRAYGQTRVPGWTGMSISERFGGACSRAHETHAVCLSHLLRVLCDLPCHCPEVSRHELTIWVLAQRSRVPPRVTRFLFTRPLHCFKRPVKVSLRSRLAVKNPSETRSFVLCILVHMSSPVRNPNKCESTRDEAHSSTREVSAHGGGTVRTVRWCSPRCPLESLRGFKRPLVRAPPKTT